VKFPFLNTFLSRGSSPQHPKFSWEERSLGGRSLCREAKTRGLYPIFAPQEAHQLRTGTGELPPQMIIICILVYGFTTRIWYTDHHSYLGKDMGLTTRIWYTICEGGHLNLAYSQCTFLSSPSVDYFLDFWIATILGIRRVESFGK
jgi:hypothetical protein